MQQPQLQALTTLHMRQKVTFMVNRYEIRADDGNGGEGELVAFAQQKRAKLKEQVTLYVDRDKNEVLAAFNARSVLDFGAGYDVTDAAGAPIGSFRKDFRRSLTRSTWHLAQAGQAETTGHERSGTIAVLRRLWEFIPFLENIPMPFLYHFDFGSKDHPVLSVQKKLALRDRYVITIQDPALDRRLVLAQAVALDALQAR